MYNMSKEEREEMGRAGRQHVIDNYGMAQYNGLWYETFKQITEDFGSWDSRKNYKKWEMFEV